ncbi:hypothetical protein M427DRAFT_58593 [Gonapodya prolifera JEL478]|uniref:Translation machinery-associated protein 16 n=1 Tax=Gonapodya prolifera (strain JEL478) TaxID=1344416 RepID=A0A139A9P9_GONPJ|nr:hypothetical protein M427DRAFT_58593 [Gonapodya prolifera JEL478]|eukprot:KXS13552.1 hypothetical protein M427DRAFT_58593 [Gonapodya prolifera JEL478]
MPNNKVKSLGHLLKPKKKANQKSDGSAQPSVSSSHPLSRKQNQLRRATLRQDRLHTVRHDTDARRSGLVDKILWFKFACPLVAKEAEDFERLRAIGRESNSTQPSGAEMEMDREEADSEKKERTKNTSSVDNVTESQTTFSKADFHELVDSYLRRNDDEIAEHEAKSSGLHRTGSKSKRLDAIEAMRKREFSEYEGIGGLEVPDLLDAKNRSILARWNGDFNSIGRIKMTRLRSA